MTNRNPYESGVDIPDFVEKKDEDIDMSVFKMANEEELNDEYDDDFDEEPNRKLSPKGGLIICFVIIGLLLISTVAGWIYGVSKNNSLNELKEEYTSLQQKFNNANSDLEEYKSKYDAISKELETLKASKVETSDDEESDAIAQYKMEGGVNVRSSASLKSEHPHFKSLPDKVADLLYYNEELDTLTTREDVVIPVYETKVVDGNTWGRIANNAWVCLVYQGQTWGTKVK